VAAPQSPLHCGRVAPATAAPTSAAALKSVTIAAPKTTIAIAIVV